MGLIIIFLLLVFVASLFFSFSYAAGTVSRKQWWWFFAMTHWWWILPPYSLLLCAPSNDFLASTCTPSFMSPIVVFGLFSAILIFPVVSFGIFYTTIFVRTLKLPRAVSPVLAVVLVIVFGYLFYFNDTFKDFIGQYLN